MTSVPIFGKRCSQCDRVVEIGVAAAPQVFVCLCHVSIIQRELAKMKIYFAEPRRMRRFVCMLHTPGKFLARRFSLMEEAGEFGVYDAGDPVDDKNLPAGKLLRLIKIGNRVVYVSEALQERHPRCVLSAQQTNDSQIQRLLNRRQLWLKFLKARAEKFRSLILQIRTCELAHQDEHQLGVSWRSDAVHSFQVLQLRAAQPSGTPIRTAKNDNGRNDEQQNTQQQSDL